MTRIPQPPGERGSLKWIQRLVNHYPQILERQISSYLKRNEPLTWLSPLEADEYAEYRDAAFLDLIGHGDLQAALAEFWPRRGPQWDALARTARGTILLVEAKAHIGEICSPGSQASADSLTKIEQSLAATAASMSATPRAPWIDVFYQLANRFAHLRFLLDNGVDARLVLINFINDNEMGGPRSPQEWQAAYHIVHHVMGIPDRNRLGRFVLHLYPSVAEIASGPC